MIEMILELFLAPLGIIYELASKHGYAKLLFVLPLLAAFIVFIHILGLMHVY